MATLTAVLPALEAMACYRAIDDAARTRPVTGENDCDTPGRPRIGDARADVLLTALLGPATPTGQRPGRDGAALTGPPAAPAVELAVVIDLATLLHLAQTPAQLPGYGPLPAPVARALAGHAPWRRWVTDPVTGHLLDYGRRTYRPPTCLAAYIQARDTTCRFPGCARRATACDLDHLQPHHPDQPDGGPTSAATLGATCRAHHQLKTHHRWTVTRTPDGTDHWTSPTGLTHPAPRPPADPRHPTTPASAQGGGERTALPEDGAGVGRRRSRQAGPERSG